MLSAIGLYENTLSKFSDTHDLLFTHDLTQEVQISVAADITNTKLTFPYSVLVPDCGQVTFVTLTARMGT